MPANKPAAFFSFSFCLASCCASFLSIFFGFGSGALVGACPKVGSCASAGFCSYCCCCGSACGAELPQTCFTFCLIKAGSFDFGCLSSCAFMKPGFDTASWSECLVLPASACWYGVKLSSASWLNSFVMISWLLSGL